ncbi:MAG TPA: hypothetical protein VGM03_08105 [Phycisphaerae bacterium]|jgi:hypothetical protein
MINREQLDWVGRNRQPRPAATPLPKIITALMKRRRTTANGAAFASLADQLGEEFQAHCFFGELRSGTLTVCVREPRLIAPLRSRWLFVIRERLGQHPSGGRVRRIEFRAASP